MEVYENVLSETTPEWAPWYVIPANKTGCAAHNIRNCSSANPNLDLTFPVLTEEQSIALEKAKAELEKE